MNEDYKNLLLPIFSGLSVFYFLYFLDAYSIQKGLSYSGHSHLFRSISFGLTTFIYLLILEVFVKGFVNIKSKKNKIIWYLLLVFIGSQITFVMFNFFWNWQELSLISYLLIQKEFPLMMIFPIALYLLLNQVIDQQSKESSTLLFCSENKKDQLKIKLSDFLFASAAENYVVITYKLKNKNKEHLIRKPLKKLVSELSKHAAVKRVHRSYLVNTNAISGIEQKKEKLKLQVNSYEIPVSKKFQHLFLE